VDYHNDDCDSENSDYDSADETSSYNGYNNCGYDSSESEIYDEQEFDEYGNIIITTRPLVTPASPPSTALEQIDEYLNDAPREKWVVLSRAKTQYTGSLPPWGWKSMPEYAHLDVWHFENSEAEPIVEQSIQYVEEVQKPIVAKSIWNVASAQKTDFTTLMMEEEAKQNIPIVQVLPTPPSPKQKVYSSSPKEPRVKSLLARPTAPVREQKRLVDRVDNRHDRVDNRHDRVDNRHDRVDNRHDRVDNRHDRVDNRHDRVDNRHDRVDNRHDRVDNRHDRVDNRRKDRKDDRNAPRARLLGNPKEKVIDSNEAPNTSTTTTASVEKRFDLLCYNKEGHDVSCKYVHNLEQWNPKICRFKENCQKIETCPFWHRERESKLQYISRSFSIKDSFFAKHKRDFKAKYLS